MAVIQIKRGLKANLPASGMNAGEPMVTTDRGTLHVAIDATTKMPVVPAIDDLASLASIDGTADLLIIHDASETTVQKEKKITFNNLKTALNIPASSTDEKVAVVAGGTAGYLYGTDGTDGVLRVGNTMNMVKDASNGFMTLNCVAIDGGTF